MTAESTTTHPVIPKRILTIGLLFAIMGAYSIAEVIRAGFHDGINLNFSMFMLPVGIGLLRGRKSSQWWASLWIILGYCSAVWVLVMTFCAPTAEIKWLGFTAQGKGAIPYLFVFLLLWAVGLSIGHRLLYSPKACAYLAR